MLIIKLKKAGEIALTVVLALAFFPLTILFIVGLHNLLHDLVYYDRRSNTAR